MRYTALNWLAHCGSDEDGVVATLAAVHDIAVDEAQRVLAALVATGEVIRLDDELFVRPGVSTATTAAAVAPLSAVAVAGDAPVQP